MVFLAGGAGHLLRLNLRDALLRWWMRTKIFGEGLECLAFRKSGVENEAL